MVFEILIALPDRLAAKHIFTVLLLLGFFKKLK